MNIPPPDLSYVSEGLTSSEAKKRLHRDGPNAVEHKKPSRLVLFLKKFYGPIPLMLFLSLVLELSSARYFEGLIIIILLLFNAILSFYQEDRAQRALSLLEEHLKIFTQVRRDGKWQKIPAEDLVVGDVIHFRLGDMVPADAKILKGFVLVDQSSLTGESVPVELTAQAKVYAGSLIRKGEATAEVTATGRKTFFGKTVSLMQTARGAGHFHELVLNIVENLVAIIGVFAFFILSYGLYFEMPLLSLLTFTLNLLVASVPVALPVTFTLADSVASLNLVKNHVLVTRLTAIEEAANMDILCTDKTGTLTENTLTVAHIFPAISYSEEDVIRFAQATGERSSQDPFDAAILAKAKELNLTLFERSHFVPFDPIKKKSEAHVHHQGKEIKVIKGSPLVLTEEAHTEKALLEQIEKAQQEGFRILGVALEENIHKTLVGFIAFQDPLRQDAKRTIHDMQNLGVRVLIVTGDSHYTARHVAKELGIGETSQERGAPLEVVEKCDVFSGVYPEDKFQLLTYLQKKGHVVGMTGDGINDAPALRQAEVGIAVAQATEVAKASSSIILTRPGLTKLPTVVKTSRRVYERMVSYVHNKLIKTFVVSLFLGLGFLFTKEIIIKPALILLLVLLNDFVTMSLSTDNANYSERPVKWHVKALIYTSIPISFAWILFCFILFFSLKNSFQLNLASLQTLSYLIRVIETQANVFLIRTRGYLWRLSPGKWVILTSIFVVIFAAFLSYFGILMSPISIQVIGIVFISITLFTFTVDALKVYLFKRITVR